MDKNNFNDLQSLKDLGFKGFFKFGELFSRSNNTPPAKGGVYLILYCSEKLPTFLEIGTGGYFKDKNPNVKINELESKWVKNTPVVYIGKSNDINKRLRAYQKFGDGKNIGHYGGRYIWQIKDAMQELLVCWMSVTSEAPELYERKLINEFIENFNQLPFANLK